MIERPSPLPKFYKAIALFTPGGDLIYGIDPDKQTQWHRDLCLGLQGIWGLASPPHFLVPGYTATIERWLDPHTQKIETIAEVHPPIERYIPLLQVLFDLENSVKWHVAPWQEEHCNKAVIETYQNLFPQLWERRDLIVRFDPRSPISSSIQTKNSQISLATTGEPTSSYGLHLFISGDRASAEKTLSSIHQLLEEDLNSPYTLKVIDISQNPQQALAQRILVTPTLVRVSPKPVRRVVGQLDDIQRVLNIITGF